MGSEGLVDLFDECPSRESIASKCPFGKEIVRTYRTRGASPGSRDGNAGESGACAPRRRNQVFDRGPEHEWAVGKEINEALGYLEKWNLSRRHRVGILALLRHASEYEHESSSLQTDQHVGTRVAGGSPNLIDIYGSIGGADEYRSLPGAMPSQSRNAARKLVVALPGQDRVDDERLKPGIPQAASFRRSRIDISRGEGHVA